MKLEKETALVEAVLFLESEPIEIGAIAKILSISEEAVKQALENLEELYQGHHHGLSLSRIAQTVQLVPKRDLWESLRERYGKKNDHRLSRAALETLSIIAYSQPITRAEVDSIRGVASDAMIKLLQQRGLVQEVGKKEAPGRPIQFGTTRQFLKFFRLSSIADLPKLEDLEREKFELE